MTKVRTRLGVTRPTVTPAVVDRVADDAVRACIHCGREYRPDRQDFHDPERCDDGAK